MIEENIKTKKRFTIVIIIGVIALLVFFLQKDIGLFSYDSLIGKTPALRTQLDCEVGVLDESVLSARKPMDELLKMLIHFSEKPSQDAEAYLADNGVYVLPKTWIFDYMIAETRGEQLCFLATLPGVTSVELGEATIEDKL